MSNEELVLEIQSGKPELSHQLWAQVSDFIQQRARHAMRRIPPTNGVTAEDLAQSGYLAVLAAVETYDAEKGSFLTWLDFYLKREFAKTGGYLTSHRDPLNEALSTDIPIQSDDGGGDVTYGETIADARDDHGAVEDRIFQEQLHCALDEAISTLPTVQSEVLKARYWTGAKLQELAEANGVSIETIRQREKDGLQRLRRSSRVRRLAEFLDENTNYYTKTSAKSYQQSGISAVEYAVFRREELRQKWNRQEEKQRSEL